MNRSRIFFLCICYAYMLNTAVIAMEQNRDLSRPLWPSRAESTALTYYAQQPRNDEPETRSEQQPHNFPRATYHPSPTLFHSPSLPGMVEERTQEEDPEMANNIPIQPTIRANIAPYIPIKNPAKNGRRKSVCCVFTHQETPRILDQVSRPTEVSQISDLNITPKPFGRRYSVTLSEISDHSSEEGQHACTAQWAPREHRDSLTTQLSVELSPHEKDEVEQAIEEIRQTEDSVSKAEKQNMLLLNVTFKQFRKVTKSFDTIAASIDQGNKQMLKEVQTTAYQTQQNLAQVQEGLQEMRRSQKKQRRLNYISFGVGICGFSLFLINFITQQFQPRETQN
ncbi:hypothetical protein [Methylicorpusculum sp.]|uniref:hypothetical protein n=1 Tax=Methylicorpusculum sp. TaxID=2713644 RepID=UPI002AB9EC90|nr:hypothetical protein [Methylicorpusculum sp.]MDZ4152943.1 hypothetical protein [Methylicorpusculum sp.]